MGNSKQNIIQLAKKNGILRSKNLQSLGLSRVTLTRLVKEGSLTKLSRGLYALPDRPISEQSTLAEVAIKFPKAIFCLLTALQVHGLTTQSPHQVWIAIDVKARTPIMEYPPLKVVRFSGESLIAGVVTVMIDGVVQVPVTCIEKTIIDCFKYRNKIGVDIAVEALHEAWKSKCLSMDELWEYAKTCRMTNVIKPYLESLSD